MVKIQKSKHASNFIFRVLSLFRISSFGFRDSYSGFTFIEVLIVFAIIGVIAAFGIIVSLDSYQRYSKHSERDLLVSLLEKARSEAVNNIGAEPHGLWLGDPNNYVLFRGVNHTSNPSLNLNVPRNGAITVTLVPAGTSEVLFTQLSGTTMAATIQVPGNPNIDIYAEGGINW
jgi:prepilin-type N-terminal cleavage/methylation domain-containing protein